MSSFLRGSFLVCSLAALLIFLAAPPSHKAADNEDDAPTSAEIREHYTKHEYRIPMRDGIKLFTAVYIPKDTSQSYPFLIDRTPYSVAPYGVDHYPKRLGPSPVFLRDAFIFVEQDVRGRYLSEGTFRSHSAKDTRNRPKDVDESTDTYDTIEWLLHNVPNNNGKAGIWGISYRRLLRRRRNHRLPPRAESRIPQAPVSDLYMGDDAYHNGAFMLAANFGFYTFSSPAPQSPRRPPSRATTTAPPTATSSTFRWALFRTPINS